MTLNLPEVLMEYSRGNSEFVFVIQGGNQGDNMIYMGANKLANSLGLKYSKHFCYSPTKVNPTIIPELDKDVVIYMHGGGGFNKWWGWSPVLVRRLREKNPKNVIIVGPSTFDSDMEMLKGLPQDVIYFAREETSYKLLEPLFPSVYLDHDTSLNLKYGDGYLDALIGTDALRSNYSLLAIRGDAELGGFPATINRSDFKIQVDPCVTKNWAQLHMNASVIMTNRCHSAILGSLLGKRTILFPGSYHKNKSIWNYSLRERGVEFIET